MERVVFSCAFLVRASVTEVARLIAPLAKHFSIPDMSSLHPSAPPIRTSLDSVGSGRPPSSPSPNVFGQVGHWMRHPAMYCTLSNHPFHPWPCARESRPTRSSVPAASPLPLPTAVPTAAAELSAIRSRPRRWSWRPQGSRRRCSPLPRRRTCRSAISQRRRRRRRLWASRGGLLLRGTVRSALVRHPHLFCRLRNSSSCAPPACPSPLSHRHHQGSSSSSSRRRAPTSPAACSAPRASTPRRARPTGEERHGACGPLHVTALRVPSTLRRVCCNMRPVTLTLPTLPLCLPHRAGCAATHCWPPTLALSLHRYCEMSVQCRRRSFNQKDCDLLAKHSSQQRGLAQETASHRSHLLVTSVERQRVAQGNEEMLRSCPQRPCIP